MDPEAASISTLGQALLGLLARQPGTGYDLAARLRRPIAYFWTAQHSQIYPELARLDRAGLIRHEASVGRGPRPVKHYDITEAGLACHRAWVTGPVSVQPARSEETLQVWSLWLSDDPDQARAWVTMRRAAHDARLATLLGERDALLAEGPVEPGQPRWSNLAAVELGIRVARSTVEWCDWLLTDHLPPQ